MRPAAPAAPGGLPVVALVLCAVAAAIQAAPQGRGQPQTKLREHGQVDIEWDSELENEWALSAGRRLQNEPSKPPAPGGAGESVSRDSPGSGSWDLEPEPEPEP
eukprot:SAG22_NODE_9161_length_606_cov_1.406312_2_plen_103_part_01